jgi:UDP-N-acetylmuramyl pentapeptide phosphotransferase/UDP-N-acetylglucosamine-1-phosphate transferase
VAKILIDQGFVISNYHGLFGIYEVSWILAQLSTVFVFLVIVNSVNFIDGIDGLAITEVIKTIFLIEFFSSQHTELLTLSLILLGCIIPLYYFNFKKKRKIFLGDGGSLLLGTIVAIYIFYILSDAAIFSQKIKINSVLFSIMILIYPLTDLLRVFLIRIKNGSSPFRPDNNHLHHIMIKKGFSHFSINLILLTINLLIFIFLWTF